MKPEITAIQEHNYLKLGFHINKVLLYLVNKSNRAAFLLGKEVDKFSKRKAAWDLVCEERKQNSRSSNQTLFFDRICFVEFNHL
uniref:Uncharacterized protein n=1 Tax=Romanomermis culicivorax TaxID=13658 RepID=A0A915JDL5_ROMCU